MNNIEILKEKYKRFNIPSEIIYEVNNKFTNSDDSQINIIFKSSIEIEKYIAEQIKNEKDDYLIETIDYLSVTKTIFKKKYKEINNIDKLYEDAIIYTCYNYNENKTFKANLLHTMISLNKNESKENQVVEEMVQKESKVEKEEELKNEQTSDKNLLFLKDYYTIIELEQITSVRSLTFNNYFKGKQNFKKNTIKKILKSFNVKTIEELKEKLVTGKIKEEQIVKRRKSEYNIENNIDSDFMLKIIESRKLSEKDYLMAKLLFKEFNGRKLNIEKISDILKIDSITIIKFYRWCLSEYSIVYNNMRIYNELYMKEYNSKKYELLNEEK